MYFSEMVVQEAIQKAISQFYSEGALIETFRADLKELLACGKIKVYKTSGGTFKECVHNLLDEHPEICAAKGMLRYYEAACIDWQDCENAEIAIANALTQDTYGWLPDSWTVFKKEGSLASLTAVVAVAI